MRGKPNPFPSSEFALLGLLLQGPCHGYELHKKLNEENGIGMIWGIKMANLYAQLDKLEQNGLISGEVVVTDQRPNRRRFSLTDPGKEAFNAWLLQPINHPRDFRQEFMVRFYFMTREYPELLPDYLAAQIEICSGWLTSTQDREETKTPPGSFDKAVIHFRQSQIQSMLDWLIWLQYQLTSIQEEII
jgi:DNA-binding PadR family transcriptional regulator